MEVQNIKKSFKIMRALIPAYLKSRFRPLPIWVHFYLTRKCNLSCSYCFVKDAAKKEMDTVGILKAIDKLHYMGCRLIAFFGGEPTLRKDLIDIIKHASKKGIITYLATNGILLTPKYISRLGESGIDIINLSVDSVFEFNGSKKDYTRSKRVLTDLIEARKKYGFEITVNMVITNKNIDATIKTIKLMHNLKIPISIGLIIGNTYSDAQQDKELFFTTGKEKVKLYNVLNEIKILKKKKYNIIEPIKYFEDIKRFLEHGADWYCAAGQYYFSIDSDGKFQLCAGLPAENTTIFEIGKDYFKKFSSIRKKRLDKCKSICFSNCLYTTSYYIKNPLYFIKDVS